MKRSRNLHLVPLAAATLALASCASTPPAQNESKPSILSAQLENRTGNHAVVITTPTAGWRFMIDQQSIDSVAAEVFITGFMPREMAAQVITTHVLPTRIASNRSINVSLRTVFADEQPSGSYEPLIVSGR